MPAEIFEAHLRVAIDLISPHAPLPDGLLGRKLLSLLNELHTHLSSIRGSYAGLEVLTEDSEVIVMLHHIFALEEMLLRRPRLLSPDWRGKS